MITIDEAREMVDDIFEQEALLIGGIVAVHGMDEDLVWRLIGNLDVIRGRVLRKLDDREDDECPDEVVHDRPINLKPHPAIQEFLLKINRENDNQKCAACQGA